MQKYRAVPAAMRLFTALLLVLAVVAAAGAEIFYDIAIKGTYEDNVVGLLSDKRGGTAGVPGGGGPRTMMAAAMGPGSMGGHQPQELGAQPNSDTSVNIFADLGGSTQIASGTLAFVIGSAQHTSYSTFTDFDSTIARLSAGVDRKLGDTVTARLALSGALKRYGNSASNSSAYSPAVAFKEQLSPAFWLRESYYYERNNADSASFTYSGNSLAVLAGYLVLPKTTVLLGYEYLVRDYDEPSGFKVTAGTVSVALEYEFLQKWFVATQYDHQASDSNIPGTSATDNIISLGVRYSY